MTIYKRNVKQENVDELMKEIEINKEKQKSFNGFINNDVNSDQRSSFPATIIGDLNNKIEELEALIKFINNKTITVEQLFNI